MTASGGLLGGGYHYEGPESRTLGQFQKDSYFDYQDQGKNLMQLNQFANYASAYMRKMQKGIDSANENFIQQIQDFINDILVLLGGGGDTGLDFGDLKYILQAIGALFGFGGGGPINLFDAAWHFVSNYIFPVENFKQIIDAIVDELIATVLGIFGDTPILGQALQQLAVIISDIRDALDPLIDAVTVLFGSFGGDISTGDLGAFGPLFDSLLQIFGALTGPAVAALTPIISVISMWTIPFINQLTQIILVVSNIIKALTGSLDFSFFTDIFSLPQALISIISNLIFNGGIFNLANLPFFPLSNLTNKTPNLLIAPGFDTPDTVRLGTNWSYDSGTGKTTPGSLKVLINGIVREVDSNNIPVQAGDVITMSIWNKWSAVAYTGTNHVTLAATTFLNLIEQSTVTVNTQTLTNANQTSWQQITGTYTVPSTGIDAIALTVIVNPNVSTGIMWFDDGSVTKNATSIPQGWISGLLDSLGGLGSFIQGLIDTMLSVIRGIPFVGGVLADLLENFTGQTNTISSTSATTNQILAALGPGTPDADDFERVNTTDLGAKWTIYKTGIGTIAIPNGHDASFKAPGLTTSEFIAISDTKALGNSPSGAIVLGTAPGYDVSFLGGSGIAFNDIWLKVADSTTSWANITGLRCRIDGGKNIYLDWFTNGAKTNIYTGTFAVTPTAGASFEFSSGVNAVNRRHVAKLNGNPIMDFSETGTVSQFGPTYLRRAFGGKLTQSTFNPVFPGDAKQWTAQG